MYRKNPRKAEDRGTDKSLVEHILHVPTVHCDAFSFVERVSFLMLFVLDILSSCVVGCLAVREHEVTGTRELRQVCNLFILVSTPLLRNISSSRRRLSWTTEKKEWLLSDKANNARFYLEG